jgi:hypothetical protein
MTHTLPRPLAHVDLDHPVVAMWLHPRRTVRRLIDSDSGHAVNRLAALSGLASAAFLLLAGSERSLLAQQGAVFGILFLTAGAALGLATVYVGAAFFGWLGSLFGGQGWGNELRTALAWSLLPITAGFLLLIAPETLHVSGVVLAAVAALLWLWTTVLWVLSFAEVEELSVWRAVAAIILVPLAAALVLAPYLLTIWYPVPTY